MGVSDWFCHSRPALPAYPPGFAVPGLHCQRILTPPFPPPSRHSRESGNPPPAINRPPHSGVGSRPSVRPELVAGWTEGRRGMASGRRGWRPTLPVSCPSCDQLRTNGLPAAFPVWRRHFRNLASLPSSHYTSIPPAIPLSSRHSRPVPSFPRKRESTPAHHRPASFRG